MSPPTSNRSAAYYDGCSAGDVALMLETLHPDVVHYFLAPKSVPHRSRGRSTSRGTGARSPGSSRPAGSSTTS